EGVNDDRGETTCEGIYAISAAHVALVSAVGVNVRDRQIAVGVTVKKRILQQANDAPDRDHNKERDDASYHDAAAVAAAFAAGAPDVLYEAPEEDNERERD